MKKQKLVTFITALLSAIFLLSLGLLLHISKHGLVFIDGKWNPSIRISSQEYAQGEYVTLPVAKTLESLGFQVVQHDDSTILLSKGMQSFTMNLEELTYTENGDERNFNWFLQPPGGGYYYCVRSGNDVIVDEMLFWQILYLDKELEYSMTTIAELKIVYFKPRVTFIVGE